MTGSDLPTTDSSRAIAFLGLGNMGLPMARNLLAAGHRVRGFDPVPDAVERARDAGLELADSAVAAVAGVQVVFTMLPNGALVLAAYPELLAASDPGTVFVDCSTISVADSRAAHDLAAAADRASVDAPVSGGVVGAEAATLTFMVGGADDAVAEVTDLLAVMGRRVVHTGGAGLGQAAKICNNMLLGVSMIGACEAFVLGAELGLDEQALYDVIAGASGQCWSVTTNCPVPGPVPTSPANRDYRPGFAAALMAKDLGLAADALDDTGVPAVLGRRAGELYRAFSESGGAGLDFSAIIERIREDIDHDR